MVVDHEVTGVHHGDHDVGHDCIEHGGDDQGLNHAPRKVGFRVHDLAADGAHFDGPREGDEHQSRCRSHFQGHRLEIFNRAAVIHVAGKQGHDAEYGHHGHGTRHDGDLHFLDGFHAREVDDQNECEKHHGDGLGIDVTPSEMLGDDFHVGRKTHEGKRRLQHERSEQAETADGSDQMAVGSLGVDVKSTRERHGARQFCLRVGTGNDDAPGEQEGKPHAGAHDFMGEGWEEKQSGTQHR